MISSLLPTGISNALNSYMQNLFFSVLKSIQVGRLEIELRYPSSPKRVVSFGDSSPTAQPVAHLIVTDPSIWWQLCGNMDVAMGEGYMLEQVECDDLVSLFTLYIRNQELLGSGYTFFQLIPKLRRIIAPPTNTVTAALGNASAHYDTSNELFQAFLSPDMNYSSAIWAADIENEALETAQLRKVHNIITKAGIQSSHHVLDIGCGWGCLAMEAVKLTGCRVTGLTLSIEQKALAEKRIKDAGLSEKIEILLCDYRKAPTPPGGYDRIVSVEMIEHVGKAHMSVFFKEIDKRLNKEHGLMVVQGITATNMIDESRPDIPNFIDTYIFPGGYLPTTQIILDSIYSGSRGKLEIRTVQSIGPHYAKTLATWRKNFQTNWETVIKPMILQKRMADEEKREGEPPSAERQKSMEWEAGVLKRKWEYYFSYCEPCFREGVLGDVVVVASKVGCRDLMEGVPF